MTTFKDALSLIGLSSQEASKFLGLSKNSIDSMMSGRRAVSDKTWRAVSDQWQRVKTAAADTEAALQSVDDNGTDPRISDRISVVGLNEAAASTRAMAAAIAVLEIIAGLPREEDREELPSEKKILLPGSDIKLPEGVGGRIGQILHRGRWYEQEMLDYIRTLGLAGTYLDVGANIGNHSLYFAANTLTDRVFSFEPTRQARRILNKFVEINDLWEKISVIPYACSDKNGEVEVIETIASSKAPEVYPCRKIDDLITGPISLVKMDIEGAEPFALRGAVRVLAESKPVMFIEVHDDNHMAEIMSIIGPIGYKTTGKVWNPSPTYEFVAG